MVQERDQDGILDTQLALDALDGLRVAAREHLDVAQRVGDLAGETLPELPCELGARDLRIGLRSTVHAIRR